MQAAAPATASIVSQDLRVINPKGHPAIRLAAPTPGLALAKSP